MKLFISQNTNMHIKFLLIVSFTFYSCNFLGNERTAKTNPKFKNYTSGIVSTSSGSKITTYVAYKHEDQVQGLSGIMPEEFADNEAMLFFYLQTTKKSFWMPNTYMNLDIFFLDKNMKVLEIARNVQKHPGYKNRHLIPKTKKIMARHVLELKTSSSISKSIQVGETLIWKSETSFLEIESKIRSLQ